MSRFHCSDLAIYFKSVLSCVARSNAPAADTTKAVELLRKYSEGYPEGLELLDPVRDLKIKELSFVETMEEKRTVEGTMSYFTCLSCPNFKEHVRIDTRLFVIG